MRPGIEGDNYQEALKRSIKLSGSHSQEVLRELESHLEERTHEFTEMGLSQKDAGRKAAELFGSPGEVGYELCEVHNQSGWRETGLAILPHLVIASLYALVSFWQRTFLVAFPLFIIIAIAAYNGWRRGKPAWLFPWFGYYFLSITIVGVLVLRLPPAWVAIAYVPVALLAIVWFTREAIREDWLYASALLLPIPIGVAWFMLYGAELWFPEAARVGLHSPWVAVSFGLLAIAIVAFMRSPQRQVKIAGLFSIEIASLALLALATQGGVGLNTWLKIVAIALFLLALPAITSYVLTAIRRREG